MPLARFACWRVLPSRAHADPDDYVATPARRIRRARNRAARSEPRRPTDDQRPFGRVARVRLRRHAVVGHRGLRQMATAAARRRFRRLRVGEPVPVDRARPIFRRFRLARRARAAAGSCRRLRAAARAAAAEGLRTRAGQRQCAARAPLSRERAGSDRARLPVADQVSVAAGIRIRRAGIRRSRSVERLGAGARAAAHRSARRSSASSASAAGRS